MPYIGNPIYQSAFVTDQFTGDGTTTAFTMSVAPAGSSNVLIAISGVLQDPSTYSVIGTSLTFTTAPPSGTGNISCRYLGVPASGVTTTAYRTVTEFTATAGQTTFTPPSYTVGFINVYLNGVLLGSADYTATNGTTVVLATGAAAGNLVTVESFLVSSVLNAIPNTAGSVGTTNIVDGGVTTAKIASGAVTLTTQVNGVLPIANGGTGGTNGAIGFKNKLINGSFDIWQRGTSIASVASTYTADRWYLLRDGNATGSTCSQVAATNTTFTYAAKVQRDSGNSGTGNLYFAQPFETQNMAALRGSYATVSFWVKAGANFSGANLKVYLVSGTGTNSRFWGGGFTGATYLINGTTFSISTTQSYQTVTTSAVIPTNATQLELSFVYTPTGTAGADDSYTIEGVQLELGTAATNFDFRSVGTELQLCQRYYEVYSNGTGTGTIYEGLSGYFATSGLFRSAVPFKVTKRTSPTMVVPTTYALINAFTANYSPSSGGSNFSSPDGAGIVYTVSGATGGQGATVGISSSVPITASAEL